MIVQVQNGPVGLEPLTTSQVLATRLSFGRFEFSKTPERLNRQTKQEKEKFYLKASTTKQKL